jgi:uncharacterized membrane protein YfcA
MTILFLLLAFVSELAGTLSGFGSSMFFVPLALYLKPFELVLGLTGILHIFGNLSKIFLFKKISWPAFFRLTIFSLPLLIVGAFLSSYLKDGGFHLIIGLFLISAGLLFWFQLERSPKIAQFPLWVGLFLSALSGFLTGLIGTGGAFRGLALLSFGLTRETFIATSAAIDLLGDLHRTGIYISKDYVGREDLWVIALLIPIAFAGSWVGRKIIRKWSDAFFRKVVLLMIFALGLMSLAQWGVKMMV